MKLKSGICFIALALIQTMVLGQVDSNATLVYQWSDTTLPASAAHNNTYNEIWGVARDGREYAIIGSTAGTHFFDVTDPANTVMVDFVPGKAQGTSIIHRDYHDLGDYLYMVCDEGESSLQIVNLSYLPDSVSLVYDDATLIKRSHNIFIDSATAHLYVCSVFSDARGYNGLEIYDISSPLNPVLLLEFPDEGVWHDIFVRNDTAYGNNAGNGLIVYDFADTANPALIGMLEFYPHKGYNHSGWLSEDGITYVLADETHGMHLKLLDVTDLGAISVLSTFTSGVDTNSIAHNPLIKGGYAYVSYYHDGFQMFDISDPSSPIKVAYYDTYLLPDHDAYRGSWGVYPFLPSGIVLVSDMQSGLFVLDVSNAIQGHGPETSENGLHVYPNPFTTGVTIELPQDLQHEKIMLCITDMQGAMVYEESVISGISQLQPDIPAGIYLVSLTAQNYRATQKLVKLR